MSAYRLSDECWQKIVDMLHDPCPFGQTVFGVLHHRLLARAQAKDPQANFTLDWETLVRAWHLANDRAVANRYRGRDAGGSPLPSLAPSKAVQARVEQAGFRTQIRPEDPDRLVGYIKLMQCLMYQCAEDVPACDQAEHTEAMESMLLAIAALGSRLATSLPVYEKMPWGAAA